MTGIRGRPRVVVVGAGFAGFNAARAVARSAGDRTEITVIDPSDFFLYVPLLPEVAAGILDPREIAVPLSRKLRGLRLVLGTAQGVDLDQGYVAVANGAGRELRVDYDHLILAPGSVNKLLPIPGVSEHALGFRNIAESLYLRDHLIRQLELADSTGDPAERTARSTFVVVGAGYTGTEVAAQGQLLTRKVARQRSGLPDASIRWLLLDVADRVLPGLSPRLSATAHRVLTRRGVEIRTETSVEEASDAGVKLSDGEFVATRSLIWCVGVRPDPLIEDLGLPTEQGRLTVDTTLTVPEHPEITACGDAAAVPDPTRPGESSAMTAQHAERQGRLAGRNVAADVVGRARKPYTHHDLGFAVDLGGFAAAADPLRVPLSGVPAKTLTRAYHLAKLPANRPRVASSWLLDALQGRQLVHLGLVEPNLPLEER